MRPDTYIALAILVGLWLYWLWDWLKFRRAKRAFVHAGRNADLGYELACTAKALRDDLLRRQGNERIVDNVVEQTLLEEES